MSRVILPLSVLAVLAACAALDDASRDDVSVTVLATTDVDWTPLNPARGDQSPQAATLWGDRRGRAPTGFLFRPVDGFSSPPHIHNVSYRGVVIGGEVHNDDPDAAAMWMPAGSFWTQPKGEPHVTSARGHDTLAYIEIDAGPYLVQPVDDAFDAGERPLNVHASNIVWVPQAGAFDVAYLWGDPAGDEPYGTLVRLPAGFVGDVTTRGSALRAVVIAGRPRLDGATDGLPPGSYVASSGRAVHRVASAVDEATVLYLRTDGALDVTSASR